jgi:hypothetical protein
MVDRIAHQMQQRFSQRLEYDAIRFDLTANDNDAHLLATVLRDVARHARQRLGDLTEGSLPKMSRRVAEAAGDSGERTGIVVRMSEQQREFLIEAVVVRTANARRSATRAQRGEIFRTLGECGGNSGDFAGSTGDGVDLLETDANMGDY